MLLCLLFWLTIWLRDMPLAMSYGSKINPKKLELPNLVKEASLSFKSKISDKNL